MMLIPRSMAPWGLWMCVSLPLTRISPASRVSAPARIFINVDLPAPFSPTSACTSPGRTSNVTPLNARTAPNDFSMPVAASRVTEAPTLYSERRVGVHAGQRVVGIQMVDVFPRDHLVLHEHGRRD